MRRKAKCLITGTPLVSCLSVNVACDRSVVFSTNKTDLHDITEILLTVALSTINKPNQSLVSSNFFSNHKINRKNCHTK